MSNLLVQWLGKWILLVVGNKSVFNFMSNNTIENFNNDIKKAIDLIISDKKEDARKFFNDVIFKKYEKCIRDKKSPLVFFEIFFSQLDDYLNSDSAVILGNVKKDDIVGSFYSDYQDDLKLALKKVQG